jgi:hypothetical protein
VASRHRLSGIFAMGQAGQATRLASPLVGSPLTYGTLSGAAIAPGQITARRLRQGLNALALQFEAELKGHGAPRWDDASTQRLLQAAEGWLQDSQSGE